MLAAVRARRARGGFAMLKLAELAMLGRPVRQDDWDELGIATPERIIDAIDGGRLEEAKALARYMIDEGKALHDLMCDWVWDLLTRIAERFGEDAMYECLRDSQSGWMLRRTWKGFLKMPVAQRVQITAEIMRSHRCGPGQDGGIDVIEEPDRFTIRMDPCGSGGRMRRGDPVDGTPSRLGPPYRFGSTRAAHDWSWGQSGVPYYCLHCAVNEMLPMEWGGHPLWVTGYDPDPAKPCHWHFYKTVDAIPEEAYTRLGRRKPPPGEGRY
jgi:hypothetical protein